MHSKKEHLIQFGTNVRKLRLDSNLSQEKLAELADMDRSYLGGVERGEHNIALLNIIRIAKALNVHPYILLNTINMD